MSFPDYINGIINQHSKFKQVEQIREQIKKMMPSQHIKHPTLTKIYDQKPLLTLQNRKTVSNFFQITNKHLFSNKASPLAAETQNNFRQNKFTKKSSLPPHRLRYTMEDSDEVQEDHMDEWREEMMKHIKPQKPIQLKDSLTQKKRGAKQQQKKQVFQAQRKLFKFKTSASLFKQKYKSSTKLIPQINKAYSQKNLILIKPTPLSQNDITYKQNEKQKLPISKMRKTIAFERPIQKNIRTSEWDYLALQKLANFQALLPFLDARKAKMETKQQKKQIAIKINQLDYLPEPEHKQYRNRGPQLQRNQPITGWQANYD